MKYRRQTSLLLFPLVLIAALCTATPARAQDSKALIDALVKKGILSNDEAAKIAAEIKTTESATDVSTGGSKFIRRMALQARVQTQFVNLDTNIERAAAQPPATNHFLLRRLYFGVKPEFTENFSGNFNYDFANLSFDAAFVTWKHSPAFAIDAGLRKVPFGYDETTSSGQLRAIERSPATNYFVGSNNGRRLGAGSYHVGVFAGGTKHGFFYQGALTNPERDEFSTGTAVANATPGVNAVGGKANNNFAAWGQLGYGDKIGSVSFKCGFEAGFVRDQGGKVLGAGDDLRVYSAFADVQIGALNLQGAWLGASNEHGTSATRGAKPWGWWLMPSYKAGNLEWVVRVGGLDSDHRGVDLSDGIRSAPGGGTMNQLTEWFLGANYYFNGNDTKLQLGYVRAESKDTVTGAPAKARTEGVRSQLQLNF
jgi:polyhydroxyalkanoate synthesis regulator phasin